VQCTGKGGGESRRSSASVAQVGENIKFLGGQMKLWGILRDRDRKSRR